MLFRFPDDSQPPDATGKTLRMLTTEQLIQYIASRTRLHEGTNLQLLTGLAIAAALIELGDTLSYFSDHVEGK